jgi:hypothetical protein
LGMTQQQQQQQQETKEQLLVVVGRLAGLLITQLHTAKNTDDGEPPACGLEGGLEWARGRQSRPCVRSAIISTLFGPSYMACFVQRPSPSIMEPHHQARSCTQTNV